MAIANDLKEFFHNEGIHSTTIQPEFEENSDTFDGCILECGPDKNCAQQTCCGTDDAVKGKDTSNETAGENNKKDSIA